MVASIMATLVPVSAATVQAEIGPPRSVVSSRSLDVAVLGAVAQVVSHFFHPALVLIRAKVVISGHGRVEGRSTSSSTSYS